MNNRNKIDKLISQQDNLKWKVNTRELLQLCVEDSKDSTILLKPLQTFQSLLIELAETGIKINNPELNDIMHKLSLIEVDNGGDINDN